MSDSSSFVHTQAQALRTDLFCAAARPELLSSLRPRVYEEGIEGQDQAHGVMAKAEAAAATVAPATGASTRCSSVLPRTEGRRTGGA